MQVILHCPSLGIYDVSMPKGDPAGYLPKRNRRRSKKSMKRMKKKMRGQEMKHMMEPMM